MLTSGHIELNRDCRSDHRAGGATCPQIYSLVVTVWNTIIPARFGIRGTADCVQSAGFWQSPTVYVRRNDRRETSEGARHVCNLCAPRDESRCVRNSCRER